MLSFLKYFRGNKMSSTKFSIYEFEFSKMKIFRYGISLLAIMFFPEMILPVQAAQHRYAHSQTPDQSLIRRLEGQKSKYHNSKKGKGKRFDDNTKAMMDKLRETAKSKAEEFSKTEKLKKNFPDQYNYAKDVDSQIRTFCIKCDLFDVGHSYAFECDGNKGYKNLKLCMNACIQFQGSDRNELQNTLNKLSDQLRAMKIATLREIEKAISDDNYLTKIYDDWSDRIANLPEDDNAITTSTCSKDAAGDTGSGLVSFDSNDHEDSQPPTKDYLHDRLNCFREANSKDNSLECVGVFRNFEYADQWVEFDDEIRKSEAKA